MKVSPRKEVVLSGKDGCFLSKERVESMWNNGILFSSYEIWMFSLMSGFTPTKLYISEDN